MENQINIVTENRKARHNYFIEDKLEAGIVLKGTEVKSLRLGRGNLKDSYAKIVNGEVFVHQMHIGAYPFANYGNHDPVRPRKLLLHKRELKRLIGKIEERGLTVVPLKLYFKNGRAKIEIGLARGKKMHDKRKDIAQKDMQRDAQRELKNKYRIKI